ncbi:RNA polymerase sigma-70 factor [uncultured Carboxylicivirga sp.]|nr:RNA polymerase sigma-70 factor [uncultured Carboxylicivirga sp.]TRX70440.1 RNA polymerase sigma-70 factor [Carboxylicivirga sp. M1479]
MMQLIVDKSMQRSLLKGDEQLYRDIFEELQPGLVVYATEYINDLDMSCSIVQEAFLKLWENRKSLREGTYLKAYMYKAVRNLCLNYLRHLKVTGKYEDRQQALQLNYEALKDKSAERLLEAEIMDRLQVAVDKMTPQGKRIFTMSRFEGKTYKEIANELGIAEKTVENQMGKALKVARAELQEFLPISVFLYSILH